jgi:Bacterial capsule synthesis protein PGA_cap
VRPAESLTELAPRARCGRVNHLIASCAPGATCASIFRGYAWILARAATWDLRMLPKRLLCRRLFVVASCTAALVSAKAEPDSLSRECAHEGFLTIAAAGDIIFQPELEAQLNSEGISYRTLWRAVEGVIAVADLAYANIEGPVAVDIATSGTSGFRGGEAPSRLRLVFNYRPSLINDMKASGFDIVSTANNHALDRGSSGVEQTITNLEKGGLPFTGTRKSGERRPWSTLTHARGLSVAWLACTYGTNGIPDLHKQVLSCFQQQEEVLAEIGRLSADPSIDAVIFTPHWGIEYSRVIERRQRDLARAAVEAGALVVVGTHPHVLQEWQNITASDGREALVIYSTGNFISAQREPDQRTGVIAILSLKKSADEHKAHLSAANYILTRISDTPHGPRVVEASDAVEAGSLRQGDRVSVHNLQSLLGACGGRLPH